MYGTILAVNLFAAIGTYARTSVIGFAVVTANLWWRSRRKAVFAAAVAVLVLLAMTVTSSGWKDRIDTIASYHSENSAYTRILVWRWTLDFVAEYPFGGGFMSYVIDRIDHAAEGDEPAWVEFGRAYHSVYFEVLGEHGWLGLALYLAIVAAALLSLHAVSRRSRGIPELDWCADLAAALQCALLTLLACGAFIGIAFQPMIWYMFALSVCLRSHLHRVERRRADDARALPA